MAGTDGGVDQPIGRLGHGERHVDCLEEIVTDHDLSTGGGVEPAQLRVVSGTGWPRCRCARVLVRAFRCREECSGVGDDLCDGAEGAGPVDVLAVGSGGKPRPSSRSAGDRRRRRGSLWRGRTAGSRAPENLGRRRPGRCCSLARWRWSPRCSRARGAREGPWRRRCPSPATAATVAMAMEPVMLDSRFSAPSRRRDAARRRCAGLACRSGAMLSRVRTHPDAYMKSEGLRLRIR